MSDTDAPRPALGELARNRIRTTLGLFASCIKSGESWDAELDAALADAFDAVAQLVALASGGATAKLLTDACDMADGRGWAMEWPDRYANLVLEASEFTEAWRGKHGDPVKEAGDVLLTYLLALGAAGVSWADAIGQLRAALTKAWADRLALAKLAAETPQFSNPLDAWAAQELRDKLLNRVATPEPRAR